MYYGYALPFVNVTMNDAMNHSILRNVIHCKLVEIYSNLLFAGAKPVRERIYDPGKYYNMPTGKQL